LEVEMIRSDQPDRWSKVERAATVTTCIAGAVGGIAVAAKAIVEYLETRKAAAESRDENKDESDVGK